MSSFRLLGFPRWFWLALAAGGLVLGAIVVQPWRDPTLLVADLPEIADNYLDYQYRHPEVGPLHFPWLGGLLTQLGVLLYCSATAVCWFTAGFLARQGKTSPLCRFLRGAGLLSLVLGLDDLLMFHEQLHDLIDPFAAKGMTLVYALILLRLLWPNRQELWATEWRVLLVSLICFTLSETIANLGMLDRPRWIHLRLWNPSPARTLCEEGLKWLGIVLWLSWFVHTAVRELERGLRSVAAAGEDRAAWRKTA
jgi:hypothetical protein